MILSSRLAHDHSIDAKSVSDALIQECAGSRIRWIPHLLLPADAMTKVDQSAANDALRHLLRTGMWVWEEERIRQGAGLGRSKAVSRRQLVVNEGIVHSVGTVNEVQKHISAYTK